VTILAVTGLKREAEIVGGPGVVAVTGGGDAVSLQQKLDALHGDIKGVISVGLATIAAAIGAGGLGEFIFRGLAMVDNNVILAGAVPAALLALTADFLVGLLEKRLRDYTVRTGWVAIPSLICLCLADERDSRPRNMPNIAQRPQSILCKSWTQSARCFYPLSGEVAKAPTPSMMICKK